MSAGLSKLNLHANLAHWQHQVYECQHSGITIKAWCEEQGISIKSYSTISKRSARQRRGGQSPVQSTDETRVQAVPITLI